MCRTASFRAGWSIMLVMKILLRIYLRQKVVFRTTAEP